MPLSVSSADRSDHALHASSKFQFALGKSRRMPSSISWHRHFGSSYAFMLYLQNCQQKVGRLPSFRSSRSTRSVNLIVRLIAEFFEQRHRRLLQFAGTLAVCRGHRGELILERLIVDHDCLTLVEGVGAGIPQPNKAIERYGNPPRSRLAHAILSGAGFRPSLPAFDLSALTAMHANAIDRTNRISTSHTRPSSHAAYSSSDALP